MLLDIDDNYFWVLITAAAIEFHLMLTGFVAGATARSAFNKEFMEQFITEHQKAFPNEDVPKGGYPDMGNGRYAEKLEYKDWYKFNNNQRVHYNYLEVAHNATIWLLIGGLYYSWVAVGLGCGLIACRIGYHCAYSRGGPRARFIPGELGYLCILGLIVLSIVSPIMMYKNGKGIPVQEYVTS